MVRAVVCEGSQELLFKKTLEFKTVCKDDSGCITQLEEVSTHKSAKTRAGTFFCFPWPLTFSSQNKWIYRIHGGCFSCAFFFFVFLYCFLLYMCFRSMLVACWTLCYLFLNKYRQTDRETDDGENPISSTAISINSQKSDIIYSQCVKIWLQYLQNRFSTQYNCAVTEICHDVF